MDPTPWPLHRAHLEGPAHLSRLPGRKALRLEARGLFARLRRFWCPKGEFPPGLFWVRLHLRTDGEGFATSLHLAACRPLGEAPVEALPGEPLAFTLLGEWLGALEGVGRVRVRLPGEAPFVVRFLARRPHLLPAPGGLVLALGVVERGRLLGEAVLRLPLPPSELPGAPSPGP